MMVEPECDLARDSRKEKIGEKQPNITNSLIEGVKVKNRRLKSSPRKFISD
jgi:hypothetical protein